jgi:hypothetical protein
MTPGFKWFPQYEGKSILEDDLTKSYYQRWLQGENHSNPKAPI